MNHLGLALLHLVSPFIKVAAGPILTKRIKHEIWESFDPTVGVDMAIEKTPLQAVRADRRCDQCAEGYFRPTGVVLASCPAQYPHRCSICDRAQTFTERYPHVVYEDAKA